MVFNAASVGVAVTPTVLETTVSHYLKRRPRRGKPTAHLSYDAALNLIRQFLVYSSHHTVEEVQSFTAQWVPAPNWVKVEDLTVPKDHLTRAAALIQAQLGPKGIEEVGGPTWWQWRRDERPLRAEWVEMKKDHAVRTRNGGKTQRTMLYVHGGGYYFGSVDEHRYQIQRHARKLQARVLCPRYRLSPQFPFPCGLLDCLATYLMMLETQAPETIILAGDSAGGGMVLALQIILRDQGIPLPAGSVLISPWVDLTHSFPSVAAENPLDYIPPYGFHHKPSAAWPPPNSDDLKALEEVMVKGEDGKQVSMRELKAQIAARAGKKRNAAASYTADEDVSAMDAGSEHDAKVPGGAENLTIVIDGVKIELKDQIQMYAPNSLLSHPLVSPVLQASLGGLPPMQVCVGGGEMLRDEQIYLAHKAAHPSDYPPPPTKYFDEADISAAVAKYPPTKVQLQVWDDLCHVGPTLSFTKPAKYMFRSIAQFGAWALAAAQRTEIRILDDDEVSDIGSATSDEQEDEKKNRDGVDPTIGQPTSTSERESRRKVYEDAVKANQSGVTTHRSVSAVSLRTVIGKAGDPLPPFHKNMIRQRVTRHGDIFPLPPASQLAACKMSPENVGIIKTGPVRKWLNAADAFDKKYASSKRRAQMRRLKQIKKTAAESMVFVKKNGEGEDETPPPAALAGRKKSQLPKATKHGVSVALGMWSGWNSKHDEEAIANEEEKIKDKEEVNMSITTVRPKSQALPSESQAAEPSTIAAASVAAAPAGVAAVDHVDPTATTDPTTTDPVPTEPTTTTAHTTPAAAQLDTPQPDAPQSQPQPLETTRSTVGGATIPFKIRPAPADRNPSTMTLDDHSGVVSPARPHAETPPPRDSVDVTATALPAIVGGGGGGAATPSHGKLHKNRPAGARPGELQRESSTKSWARNVLRRSGIGSVSKGRPAKEGSVPPVPAVAVVGAGAGAGAGVPVANGVKNGGAASGEHRVAVDAGEVVDAEVRPEPTRFKTAAQEL